MNNDFFKKYSGGTVEKLIYNFHPIHRLSEDGILERYEKRKWIPEEKSDMRRILIKQIGIKAYLQYLDSTMNLLSENNIIGIMEMRLWARGVKESKFTLFGLVITFLGLIGILPFPIGLIIGLIISGVSLLLNLFEIKKPLILKKKQ